MLFCGYCGILGDAINASLFKAGFDIPRMTVSILSFTSVSISISLAVLFLVPIGD
jgi:hypothetical protein